MFAIVAVSFGFSKEEFRWVFFWKDYNGYLWHENRAEYEAKYKDDFWSTDKIIPMPVLTERPQSTAELKELVVQAMSEQKSLDWALDSLKPATGPAASLADSVRREMLYVLYHDMLSQTKKPWSWGNETPTDLFFSGGVWTYEEGWGRYAHVYPVCLEEAKMDFTGYFTALWNKTADTLMDSALAMGMLQRAVKGNMLVNRLSNPLWRPVMSFEPCVYHKRYKLPAFKIEIPVEYDCCNDYPEVFRRLDTMIVITCLKSGYEYLIAYSQRLTRLYSIQEDCLTF